MEALTTTQPLTAYDVTDDVRGIKTAFVNVFFIGHPGQGNPWVLVDAGLPGYADAIRQKAESLFGDDNPPRAIVLTHGHGDHVGSLENLLENWQVPVYAHRLEHPYLTGKAGYPPPDPGIGGGLMAYMSWIFPTKPIDINTNLRPVPDSGTIRELPGWRFLHTPGHAPGHVSLFRDSDRTLIAGDAFVTTNQNSAYAVATQKIEVHGPPAYFTIDWEAARHSVEKLAGLHPAAVGTGHGQAVRGLDLQLELSRLVNNFDKRSIPSKNGRYVKEPVVADENGIVSMPAPTSFYVARAIGIGVLTGLVLAGVGKLVSHK